MRKHGTIDIVPRTKAHLIPVPGTTWARFGDTLLIIAGPAAWDALAGQASTAGMHLESRGSLTAWAQPYLVIQEGRSFQQRYPDVPPLLDKGRYLAVALDPHQRAAISDRDPAAFTLRSLAPGDVIFDIRDRVADRQAPLTWVQHLLGQLRPQFFAAELARLAAYPTRLSNSTNYQEAAAQAQVHLERLGYATSVASVSLAAGSTANVIADLQGRHAGAHDLVLLTAHLDSINTYGGASASAPGADDNASGCAGLLEMARTLMDHHAAHDLRLILFGGEEQGLCGSYQYVAALPTADRMRLRAVINMDMIGSRNTSAPTVLLEGAPASRALLDSLAAAAATYTGLTVQTSLHAFGSDHVPFIKAGLPAVLTIEGADDTNTAVHTSNDTIDRIDQSLAFEILRMNLAAVAIALSL